MRGVRVLRSVVVTVAVLAAVAVAVPAAPALADGGPLLRINVVQPVVVPSNGRQVVHVDVSNIGTEATGAGFAVMVHLVPGAFATDAGPGCRIFPFGHTEECDFPAGLRPGAEDSIDVPFETGNPPGVYQGSVEVQSCDPVLNTPAPLELYVV